MRNLRPSGRETVEAEVVGFSIDRKHRVLFWFGRRGLNNFVEVLVDRKLAAWFNKKGPIRPVDSKGCQGHGMPL